MREELHRQDSRADAFVVGRRTFEDLRDTGLNSPTTLPASPNTSTESRNYVVSSTMTDPKWPNSTVLGGDPLGQVGALKEQPGHDTVVTGSITLCHTLVAAGLIDEYRLFGCSVVQGHGRRLLPDRVALPALTSLETKSFGSGVTYSRYVPA